jgi:hypothetical protein
MKLSADELRRLATLPAEALPEVLKLLADRAQIEDEAEHKEAERRARNAHRMRTKRAQRSAQSEHSPSSLLPPTPPINSPPSIPTESKQTRAGAGAKRLPAEWHPTEAHWQKARDEWGIADSLLRFETSAFRDHWRASALPTARKLDWGAAWLNWIRKLKREQRGRAPPQHNGLEAVRRQLAEVERREQNGERGGDFKLEPEP